MNPVRQSACASLFAQFVIGAVVTVGFFVGAEDDRYRADLDIILAFELTSQVIEFLWYASVLACSRTITARLRYIDWVFSTPTMLISFAMFFQHRAATGESVLSVFDSYPIYASLAVNWVMLAFGFALESGAVSSAVGLVGGGVALVGAFAFLALYVTADAISQAVFWATFAVWGLYGVAAALADVPKNVMYNAIDVVSKNGFGLFIFVYALTV